MSEHAVVVEQLNESQWHAFGPDGHVSGAGNYVYALSRALAWATLDGLAVETHGLAGTRRQMMPGLPLWAR